jgi:hypothetical protein
VPHTPRHRHARLALAFSCCLAATALSARAAPASQTTTETFGDQPDTSITNAPKRKTTERSARFAFSSSEPGSTFRCKLDRGSFKPCGSPATYRRLKPRKNTLRVRAVDRAGRVDLTPAAYRWKVVRRYDPERDVEGNDLPPPPGSPAAKFEKECAEHPVICA